MVAAFEELIGSHGGLGGWQTRAQACSTRPIGRAEEPPRRASRAPPAKAWLTAAQRGGVRPS